MVLTRAVVQAQVMVCVAVALVLLVVMGALLRLERFAVRCDIFLVSKIVLFYGL